MNASTLQEVGVLDADGSTLEAIDRCGTG